ncbi:MAG: hypothetical protein AB7G76_05200 [Steroidobacteraceae bacterium]|uniref:anti-sigma factor family protein n=1 Tax=Alcaligenes sp. SMD-FA TaxID=2991054 RepID=UPI0022270C80|nr:hypothetical protein [Alcaligenes sp. SMD-FA]UYY86327.1 hypothetical protein OKX01_13570 [Alcaligenes sp. SMD-FA]
MLNCNEVTQLFSESQERKLTLKETMDLKLHTLMCTGCRNFGKHMQALRIFARSYAQGEGAAKHLPLGSESDQSKPE